MLDAASTLRRWVVRPDVVAVVGAVLTLVVAAWFMHLVEQRARERFMRLADQAAQHVDTRLETYIALLRGAGGLFGASDKVTPGEFERYIERLDLQQRYPGAQGVGYAVRVGPEAPPAAQARALAELPPGVKPWPGPAPQSAIVMLLPDDARNRAAMGFDMYSEPVRREAMARARDQGVPAASGRVVLKQEIDPEKQAGFLIYTPVYAEGAFPETVAERQAAHVGWVYAPFRTDDLFRQTFAGTGLLDQVDVEVDDLDGDDGGRLYLSAPPQPRPRFQAERHVDAAGRHWHVRVSTNAGFHTSPWWRTVLPVLLAGFGLTATSAWAAHAQGRGLARALAAEVDALRAKARTEFLLREVNHRVANSLQLVSALVGLQADAVTDPAAKAALRDTRARILAVGRVHQRLYGEEGAEHVDLRAYLEHLVEELAASLPGGSRRLAFLGAVEAQVSADQAVAVGVAVAELVTNAVKYAYPDGAAGEVRVRLDACSRGLEVCVEDDGVGLPPGAGAAGSGLGMTVVRAMAADLSAELLVGPGADGRGLRAALRFAPTGRAPELR